MFLPHPKRLAQECDRPGHAHPADERHPPCCQRQPPRRHHEARGQLLQPQAPAVLRRRLPSQPRVDVLGVDRLLQSPQLPTQVTRPGEVVLEQRVLEPAVEILDAAVELRLPFGDEHGADAVAQAQPDHPRQGPRRLPPAGPFAGVVELDLRGPAQVLPALAEEPQDLVHAAGLRQEKADGPVERVLADPDVVAVPAAPEVDRPNEIDLVQVVGGPSLRAGPLLAGQQRGEADPRRGQAVALEHPLDGARVSGDYSCCGPGGFWPPRGPPASSLRSPHPPGAPPPPFPPAAALLAGAPASPSRLFQVTPWTAWQTCR